MFPQGQMFFNFEISAVKQSNGTCIPLCERVTAEMREYCRLGQYDIYWSTKLTREPEKLILSSTSPFAFSSTKALSCICISKFVIYSTFKKLTAQVSMSKGYKFHILQKQGDVCS